MDCRSQPGWSVTGFGMGVGNWTPQEPRSQGTDNFRVTWTGRFRFQDGTPTFGQEEK